MSYETLPNVSPSYSSSGQVDMTVLRADFGDGYSQKTEKGLNNVRDTWSLVWTYTNASDLSALETFLRGKKGSVPFWWTPPGESVPKLWTCGTFKKTPDGFQTQQLDATFLQEFDL